MPSQPSAPQFVTKTATSTSSFIDSIGVNTHLAYNASPYANINTVSADLNYLGIHNIRDQLYTTTLATSSFETLAAQGYKFDLTLATGAGGVVDVAGFIANLDIRVSKYAGSIAAIEGPNEVNNWKVTYNGVTSIASGAEIQKQIFAAVNADSLLKDIPVYNVTIGSTDANQFAQLGNLSSATDYANEHAYVMSTTNISNGLDFLIPFSKISAPNSPVVITETGYSTLPSYWYNGVSETVQAKYTLDLLLDAYQKGVAKTFLYELLDESNLAANSPESHYGLFNADGTPKLAATAIHNLTEILKDNGTSAASATGSLTYALSGTPTTSHDMVLAKSDGRVDLVLWAEPVLWNQNTHSEVQATAAPVTVTFAQTEALVKVYDPLLGSGPIATYANVSSIQVIISDHPIVIEVTPVATPATNGAPVNASTTQSYVGGVLASETTIYNGGPDISDTKTFTGGVLTRETIVHADNSKDVYIYGVKNQNYVAEHDTFNAAGVMTSMVRTHANGTFAYSFALANDGTKTTDLYDAAGIITSDSIVRADGSSDIKLYSNGLLTSETVTNASGPVASVSMTYTGGMLTSQNSKFATGSADRFEVKTYVGGNLVRDDIVHADNSEDVYLYGIQGRDYVAGHDFYNSARVLTNSVRTHSDGSLAYIYNVASDGTKTTDTYDSIGRLASDSVVYLDGSSDTKTYVGGMLSGETLKFAPGSANLSETKVFSAGVLTSDTIVHADKSKDVFLFGIQNKSYVAEHDVYNAAGVLTSTVRSHADSTLDYTYHLDANGTKTTDTYDAAGVLKTDMVVRADGSAETKTYTGGVLTSDIIKFAPGSANLTESKTYTTAGVLTTDTIVHADKTKDVYDTNVVGKSYVADHFNYDATGKLTMADYTNTDGSHTITAYAAGVTMTSTAGVADKFTSSSFGGDNFVFKANSGNDTITGFHAGNAFNHDTITLDSSIVSDFQHLSMQQVNQDTLITLGAHDTILLKNVAVSALTSADFHFVQHDLMM